MPDKGPARQAGIVHLFPIIVVALLVGFLTYFVVTADKISEKITKGREARFREAGIELRTAYNNPLEKETQYVNPFSDYKNPIDNLE